MDREPHLSPGSHYWLLSAGDSEVNNNQHIVTSQKEPQKQTSGPYSSPSISFG